MFQLPSLEDFNLVGALPGLIVAGWACILLLVDLFIPKNKKSTTAWLAALGIVVAFFVNIFTYNLPNQESFLGMFRADAFTGFVNIILLVTGFIAILMSLDYLKRIGIERGEYYILMLFSLSGMMFMGSANDLVSMFIALELLSIPLYILSAFRSPDLKSEESGLKYFLLGAFASAFFVYGCALIYGATGTTNLPEIFGQVQVSLTGESGSIFLLVLGAGLVLVGLGFKVAVVPFHMWTPDVYEGAPSSVTAFMSVGAKTGGFAAMLRLLIVGLSTLVLTDVATATLWQNVAVVISIATLILGNFVAISQSNIKRMLAYSSIAHAGYIMIAVAASGSAGIADEAARAALLYMLAYAFTNLGAFGVAMAVEKNDGTGTSLSDFIGLSKRQPILAFMMLVFMLSLIGIPLTAGFIGKAFVFQAALNADLGVLAVVGVITSAVSAFYYIRIVVNMYLHDNENTETPGDTPYLRWAVYIAFAGTIVLGILPFLLSDLLGVVSFGLTALIP